MIVDQELQGWLKDWQHAGTGPEVRHLDIRKRVRRQNFRMVLSLAGQLLVAAGGIAVAAFMVWRRPEPAILFSGVGNMRACFCRGGIRDLEHAWDMVSIRTIDT